MFQGLCFFCFLITIAKYIFTRLYIFYEIIKFWGAGSCYTWPNMTWRCRKLLHLTSKYLTTNYYIFLSEVLCFPCNLDSTNRMWQITNSFTRMTIVLNALKLFVIVSNVVRRFLYQTVVKFFTIAALSLFMSRSEIDSVSLDWFLSFSHCIPISINLF